MGRKQALIIVVFATLAGIFFVADLSRFLTLEYLQGSRERIIALVEARPVVSSVTYFLAYVLVTGLSLPGAVIFTLAGGAIFGALWGTVLASFASSVGATIAFLVSRTLLQNWVRNRFGAYFEALDRGFEKDGLFYLFSIRMVPAFPYFAVNLLMGLTRIGVGAFYAVSQLGMLAATFVFVYAGTQLGQIRQLGDILSLELIFALSLLGLFPLLAKKALALVNRRRASNSEAGG